MRQPPREIVMDVARTRLPAGAGFAVAVAMSLPLYAVLAFLL